MIIQDQKQKQDTGLAKRGDMKFKTFIIESASHCPKATYDLALNLENRQTAIDHYGYGPLNPQEPSTDFWKAKADMWNVSVKEAKTARCGNCAAFVITDDIRSCITNGRKDRDDASEADYFEATINKADLGYCNILHFKCAGERTCDAWLTGGPIDNKDVK